MDLVLTFGLGLALGSVLGYWSALPRVNRLERELAQEKRLLLGLARILERREKE